MSDFIEPALEKLVGRKCKFETRDGSVRTEKVVAVQYMQLEIGGVEVDLPITLFFDPQGLDGVELRIVKSIHPVK